MAKRVSVDQLDQRFAFFHDVRRELRTVRAADVLGAVDGARRNEEHITGSERYRRFAVQLVLQLPFEHIDDLLAGMAVSGRGLTWIYINAHLDDLAAGGAEIVPLQVGAMCPRLWRRRSAQSQ